jgi:peptidoglycan/LPS O-acetylase OafA/YrhL
MTSPDDTNRIPELDGLRGITIGTVLVFHYFVLMPARTILVGHDHYDCETLDNPRTEIKLP